MNNHKVKCSNFEIANNKPFTLIAGPCQLESEEHAIKISNELKKITSELGVNLIYKTSFDKANRTSLKGKRGLGLEKSLPIFDKIRKEVGVPVLTDVHTAEQCSVVSNHVDVLQIPAFLCRQTDLLIAAAKTGKIINVKKGQFLAPWDMANVIKKTHSVQQPGGMGEKSGGQREFVPYLARAAIAVGVGAIFMETHEDPDNAPSDGPNMVPLNEVKTLLKKLTEIDKIVK